MQGDLILIEEGPVLVVTHACSMRRGIDLHSTQTVAPVENHNVTNWDGSYDWMPLPGASVSNMAHPAALLRALCSVATDALLSGNRVAVMSNVGIQLLQQRLAHHLTRVAIAPEELAEHCAPILAEAELHEDWVGALGSEAEKEFQGLLDADGRKLRSWLVEPAKRAQAMRSVRQEIRRRSE